MKSSYTILLWLSHVCCMHLELCICAGFETARSLALHGCTVVFACRDITRTQAAIDRIKEERAHAVCDVIELDLARLHSVTKFAATMKLRYKWALPILTISNICVGCNSHYLPFKDPLRHCNCSLYSVWGNRGNSEQMSKWREILFL